MCSLFRSNQWIFDDVDYQSINWVGDLALGQVEVDCEEELMSCVYESFCME